MRESKTYEGILMEKGTKNEEVLLSWLKKGGREVIDFREFRLAQRIDVDFGIETINKNIILAEIKSDKWIKEDGNLCFECFRINHYVQDKWFFLGWGWRSPAQKLIVRNPETKETFVFDFALLRKRIGEYVLEIGKQMKINITLTDEQKTTYNFLIPLQKLNNYKKYII